MEPGKYKPFFLIGNMPVVLTGTVALILVYWLKLFYSSASCSQLAWILRPLSILVGFIRGVDFELEQGCGYVSNDGMIIIAKSCSGCNFLIISFCLLVICFLCRANTGRRVPVLAIIPGAAIAAYLMTLVANTFRIVLSVEFYAGAYQLGWLTPERIHCIGGIIIYFTFLCISFTLLNYALGWRDRDEPRGRRDCASPYWLVPLFCYTMLTIVVPLLNGAYRTGGEHFPEYAVFVISIPAIMTLGMRYLPTFVLKRL